MAGAVEHTEQAGREEGRDWACLLFRKGGKLFMLRRREAFLRYALTAGHRRRALLVMPI